MDNSSDTDDTEELDHSQGSQQYNLLNVTSEDFLENEVALCVYWKSGKLGAASYAIETSEISLLNDVVDIRPDFQILKQLFQEIQPTLVITCSTSSSIFLDCVKSLVSIPLIEPKIKFNVYSSKHFNYTSCKKLVSDMKTKASASLLEENRTHYLHSIINFDYTMMISALGALLSFLDKYFSKISLQLPSQNILSLQILNLSNLVWIDQESYNALEIFSNKIHPSSFKWSDKEIKEGFSIYGLFNRCSSRIGSNYMRILLSHPIKDIDELRRRHEVIDFFLNTENETILRNIRDCLANICNITNVISQIIGTQAAPRAWKTFYKTIYNAVAICRMCHNYKNEIQFFSEISNCLNENIYTMINVIDNVMDFEASQEYGRFVIKEGSVPELDEVKEKQKNLPRLMEEVAEQELLRLPEVESCSLVYLPEIGYLLAIPAWKENLTEEDLMIPNTCFKFMLNNVAHYKTATCEEMDEVLGDSHLIVMKHETEIMYQISNYIRTNIKSVMVLLDKIKKLDCLIAFSDVAREFSLIKPELVEENVMHIEKGRHILQQLCTDTFVANDFHSSREDTKIKVFTGPNASGKSVYLKQVALIAYLAHTGSFIPAEKASIGILDNLHTRIQTTESISSQVSSFMLDLRQMYSCLFNSTPKTLIVIDEFGKGTGDVDGLSLLSSCVNEFLSRGENCPHLLISTHFHSLMSLIPKSPLIKSQTLEFLNADGVITYLYKVKDGSVGRSFALNAAAGIGFSTDRINRASEILQLMQQGQKPTADLCNSKTLLMNKRKKCLYEIVHRKLESEEDVEEIVNLLNNVRT